MILFLARSLHNDFLLVSDIPRCFRFYLGGLR